MCNNGLDGDAILSQGLDDAPLVGLLLGHIHVVNIGLEVGKQVEGGEAIVHIFARGVVGIGDTLSTLYLGSFLDFHVGFFVSTSCLAGDTTLFLITSGVFLSLVLSAATAQWHRLDVLIALEIGELGSHLAIIAVDYILAAMRHVQLSNFLDSGYHIHNELIAYQYPQYQQNEVYRYHARNTHQAIEPLVGIMPQVTTRTEKRELGKKRARRHYHREGEHAIQRR